VVCDRILNADSAFQIFQFIFQTADQALQVRHASPASDEPEIEIVGVVRQGDVDCLPVQRDPQRIVAVEPRAVCFVRPGRLRDERRRLNSGFGESIAVYLNGQDIPDRDMRGQRVTDDSFILCISAHHEPIEFAPPPEEFSAT
jgi:hypothetical protein